MEDLFAYSTGLLIVMAAVFFVGGMVKGVIGLGLPAITLALLAAVVGLKPAMAMILAPALVTNVWQSVAGGALGSLSRRLWPLLAGVVGGIFIGVHFLARLDTPLLAALLGLLLASYALYGLGNAFTVPLPDQGVWTRALIGGVNGLLTGLTGAYVMPAVPYFQALHLPRDELVQAMGMLFLVSTIALGAAMANRQLLPNDLLATSVAGIVPALCGMTVGRRLRQRLSPTLFRRLFFSALLALGLWIIVRSLADAWA